MDVAGVRNSWELMRIVGDYSIIVVECCEGKSFELSCDERKMPMGYYEFKLAVKCIKSALLLYETIRMCSRKAINPKFAQ